MPFDSFNLFPLLPIEIRLLIWIMTFPEGRRIEPWMWDRPRHPSFLLLFPHHRPSHSGPGFNLAKTDPVALWVNRESREEVFKHYAAREPAHLQHLERRYNVRWPAHINFSKDTFSFGWNCTGRSIRPCDFLTKTDMDSIAHLELNSLFDAPVGNGLNFLLNQHLSLYSNLQDIFVNVRCSSIEGDEWGFWQEGPNYMETGSISRDLREAQGIGEALLERFDIQCRGEGRAWKRPLLILKATLNYVEGPIEEVMQLVDDFRSAAG